MKKFLSGSIVLIIGTLFMGVLNYAYNLLVNRLLLPADYASFTALLGLFAIITVPLSALQTVAAKYAAQYQAAEKPAMIRVLLSGLTKRVLPVGIIAFLIFVLVPHGVASLLGAGTADSVILAVRVLGTAFLLQILVPINRGVLQGMQDFLALSLNYVVDALGRFGVGVLVFLPLVGGLSWSVGRAVLAGELKIETPGAVALAIGMTIIGSSVAYLISFWPLRRLPPRHHQVEPIDGKDILNFSWPTVLMFIFLAILFNVDVILVKTFSGWGLGITPDNAGEYATISTLAKMVFFITGPLTAVMFPMISDLVGRGQRHYKLLLTTFTAVLAASLVILGVFAAAPTTVVTILTPNYVHVASLLVPMTVIFVLYSLVNLLSNYYLSIKQYRFVWPLGLAALIEVGLIYQHHGTVMEIVKSAILAQTLLLIVFLVMYLVGKRQQFKELLADYVR